MNIKILNRKLTISIWTRHTNIINYHLINRWCNQPRSFPISSSHKSWWKIGVQTSVSPTLSIKKTSSSLVSHNTNEGYKSANLPSLCNKSVQNQMMDPSPHLLNTRRERLSNFQNWFSNTRCHRRFRNILSSSRKQKFGFSGLPNIRYGGRDCYVDPCWGSSSFRDSAECNLIVQLEGK